MHPAVLQNCIARLNLQRFFRGEGPETGTITLDRRRVFILPTREGVMFGAMLLAMLIGAINYNNNLAFALTFLLSSLALVSTLHTYRNVAHLAFRAGRARPVFCGNDAQFSLHIVNQWPVRRFAVTIEAAGGQPVWLDIEPHESRQVVLAVPTTSRGRLPLGRFRIGTRYPLGLFRAWSYLDLSQTCLVYPRPGPLRRLPQAPTQTTTEVDGAGPAPGAANFSGFRQYQAGDSLRQVHWKAAARTEMLFTKQFTDGARGQVWLDWAQLPGMAPESRLSQLCRWVLDAAATGTAYGLRLPGVCLTPATGERHRERCLRALALFRRHGHG